MPFLFTPPPALPPAAVAGLAGLGATAFAEAIGRMEGWPIATSPARRNNNPGNLTWAPSSYCQKGKAGAFVVFCDAEAGWAALEHQIQVNAGRDLTLYEFFAGKPGVYAGYAPADDGNDPVNYAQKVAGWLGVSPNDKTAAVYSGVAAPAPPPAPGGQVSGNPVMAWDWLNGAASTVEGWFAGATGGAGGEYGMVYAAAAVAGVGALLLLSDSG